MITASSRFDVPFTCVDGSNVPTAPTGTPTGTLVKNGTDLGTTVTVTMSTARGIASCTIPSDAVAGDRFYIRLSAVISGTTYEVPGPVETVYTHPLDAAGVRSAVGLASANLDTQLTTIDDLLDTEVAAIKAKTDNLPSDPADQSAVEAAITSATSSLATASALSTLAGYVDTEVAAIKAKTDQLTFTTANVVDASPTSAADIRAAVGLASANLDTQLADIASDASTAEIAAQQWLGVDTDIGITLRTELGLAGANLDTQLKYISDTSAMITRSTADTKPIAFMWTAPSLTLTGTVSIDDGAFQPVVGAITYLRSEGDQYFYQLAYNAADRPSSEGSARYTFTHSGTHVHVMLRVENPITAAGVRTAVGLASANLDTQLSAIDDFLDTEVAAIKAKTDNLPSDPADQSAVEAAITAATSSLATSAAVSSVAAVTTKLDTTMVLDGAVYQFTANALELGPSGGGGGAATVLVYPLNATMPVKSTGPNLTFYTDESGVVVGPIQVSARSGNTITPVDLSGRTLEVRFSDYLGTELLTVVNADITISGDDNDHFEFEVTTAVTGTATENHPDQYHYWSLRDISDGDNVLVAGRARVLLS